jgi:hypothetical protein
MWGKGIGAITEFKNIRLDTGCGTNIRRIHVTPSFKGSISCVTLLHGEKVIQWVSEGKSFWFENGLMEKFGSESNNFVSDNPSSLPVSDQISLRIYLKGWYRSDAIKITIEDDPLNA